MENNPQKSEQSSAVLADSVKEQPDSALESNHERWPKGPPPTYFPPLQLGSITAIIRALRSPKGQTKKADAKAGFRLPFKLR
ncbi:hypothetical protein JD969_06345 [Planctomycetota bacterium]|nr:hypothetical protein JD969_06345 [Planctomycetota bacterium]